MNPFDAIKLMREPFAAVDAQHRCRYVNRAICEMTGFEASDLIGRAVQDLIVPADHDRLAVALEDRRNGGNAPYEVHVARRGGGSTAAIARPEPIFDSDGEFVGSFGVAVPIESRKRIDEHKFDVARMAGALAGERKTHPRWDVHPVDWKRFSGRQQQILRALVRGSNLSKDGLLQLDRISSAVASFAADARPDELRELADWIEEVAQALLSTPPGKRR